MKYYKIKEKLPENLQLVLVCTVVRSGKRVANYSYKVARFYAKENRFFCPYETGQIFPTHWTKIEPCPDEEAV